MTTRLKPLTPPYEPAIEESLRRLMGPVDADPLALFRTIAHHPALLERFRQTGSTLLSFGRLPAADRETVIHRTCARCGAAYEWGVHAVAFAAPLGLDDEWLRATWHGGPDDFADSGQALLVRFADELHDSARSATRPGPRCASATTTPSSSSSCAWPASTTSSRSRAARSR
jgi:4-carboxymuconolactone decarboxylase